MIVTIDSPRKLSTLFVNEALSKLTAPDLLNVNAIRIVWVYPPGPWRWPTNNKLNYLMGESRRVRAPSEHFTPSLRSDDTVP